MADEEGVRRRSRRAGGEGLGADRPGGVRVGDVVLDGLTRAGVSRLCVAGGVLAGVLAAGARAQDLDVVAVGSATTACLVAAVAARLAGGPAACAMSGSAVVEARAALVHAARDRAALIVIGDGAAEAGPDVKASVALDAAFAAHWTAHALQLAMSEPRGPVQLVVPPALLSQASVPAATIVRPPPSPPPDASALAAAASALVAASHPVALAGLGCRRLEASAWLRPFAEALPVPVLVTPRGRGALPDPHPLMLGVLGTPESQRLLARADLVIALGVDVIELEPRPWSAATAVLWIGRTAPGPDAAASVSGDVGAVLEELAPRLRGRAAADWDVAELDRLKRAAVSSTLSAASRIAATARQLAPPGAVAAVDAPYADDVGRAWHVLAPDELLAPAAPVSGFAVAAAVAAKLARPAAPVLALADAGPAHDVALEVAARLALPVVAIVIGGRGSPAPVGVPIAEARDDAALRRALDRALAGRRPMVLDARVQ